MKTKIIISSVIICFIVLSFGAWKDVQAQTATLSLVPASGSYNLGDSFQVEIRLNTGGTTVIGTRAYINFDSQLSIPDGKVDVAGSALGTVLTNKIIGNQIQLELLNLSGVSGSNLLIGVVNFKADNSGTANVSFEASSKVNEYTGGTTSKNILETIQGGSYSIIAPGKATLGLSPSSGSFEVGQSFDIDIVIDSGGQVTDGADVHYLNFNPSLLEAVSVAPGSLYPVTDVNKINKGVGRIDFSQTTSGGTTYNGQGTLATISFKALAKGTAQLTFDFTAGKTNDCNISRANGQHEDILSSVTNGNYNLVDTTAPANVSNFQAAAGDGQVALSWVNPTKADFAGVKIVRKTSSWPSSHSDGTEVYNGLGTSKVDSGLTNGTTYYYKAFSYDQEPNYSSGAQVSATPEDASVPGAITDLEAKNPTLNSIELSWTASGDNGNIGTAASYDIRYLTSNITEAKWASASQVTGEPDPQVAGTKQSMVVTGLAANTNYFFALKAADSKGNQSALSNIANQKTLREKGFKIKIKPEGKVNLGNLNVWTTIFKSGTNEKVLENDEDTTDSQGFCKNFKNLTDFTDEEWDIKIKIDHYLIKKINQVNLLSIQKETTIEIELLAGNFQDVDNVINELDWSVMASKWHTADLVTDINQDGDVNTLDWHYLNKNWGLSGD